MIDLLLAALFQVAVLWGLGALIVVALRVRWDAACVVAVAPVVSLGALYVARSAWDLSGIGGPLGLPAILVAVGAAVGAAVAVRARRPRAPAVEWRRAVGPATIGLLVVATTVGVGLWLFDPSLRPPGWDSMNHAFMTRLAADAGGLAPGDVCVTGVLDPQPACDYYPLAVNHIWALGLHAGVPIADSMLATLVFTAPISVLTGMFAMQRRLGLPVAAAGVSAFAAAALGPLWMISITGRLTAVVGLALVPATALAVVLAVGDGRWRRDAIVAGFALVGLLGTHSNDALLAGALAVLAMFALPPPARPALSRLAGAFAGVGVATLVLGAPVLHLLAAAGAERAVSDANLPGGGWRQVSDWVFRDPEFASLQVFGGDAAWGIAGPLLAVLAPLGVVAAVRFRPLRPWAGMFVLLLALGLVATSGSGPLRSLVRPWYGDPHRIAWGLVLVRPVLAAGAVATVWQVANQPGRAGRLGRSVRPRGAGLVVASLSVALLTLTATADVRRGRDVIEWFSPFGDEHAGADDYLRGHVPPGAAVLDDRHHDGGTWTYAETGVPVAFGLYPLGDEGLRDYNARLELLMRVGNGDTSARTRELLERYRVSHVLTRGSILVADEGVRTLSTVGLDANPMLERVFDSPGASVYRVRDLPGTVTNDRRVEGQRLLPGSELTSPDGRYRLAMQPDGDVVVRTDDGRAVWSVSAEGVTPRPGSWLAVQPDGNVVLTSPAYDVLWHTSTTQPGSILVMRSDGTAAVRSPDGVIRWSTPPLSDP